MWGDSFSRYKWILLAIVIAILYWLMEGIIDAFFFWQRGLWLELFRPSIHEIWMRSIIVFVMVVFGIYVQYSVNNLRKSKEKIDELYSLILSIRNINQLIVQEEDLEELLQKTADTLIETRGYIDAALAISKDGKITSVAHSGDDKRMVWSVEKDEKIEFPRCVAEILESQEEKVIESTAKFCKRCEYCEHKSDHKTVVMPLIRKDKVVGSLHACLREDREIREEELDLLEEIASDLAYAREKFLVEEEKRELERKRRFLNTILRQDLRSKNQLAAGSLQLLEEEEDLSKKGRSKLRSALDNNLEAVDMIEKVRELKEVEEIGSSGLMELVKTVKEVMEDNKDIIENKGVEFELDRDEKVFVKGDYSIKNIFHNLLYGRIEGGTKKIEVSIEDKEKARVIWEDDGDKFPDNIQENLSRGDYTGESAGMKGFRYYIAKELVDHNDAIMKVSESSLGGVKFELEFEKS